MKIQIYIIQLSTNLKKKKKQPSYNIKNTTSLKIIKRKNEVHRKKKEKVRLNQSLICTCTIILQINSLLFFKDRSG